MRIKEEKLTIALNAFVDEMDDRLAEEEAEGYLGWDNSNLRLQLAMAIRSDAKKIEYGLMDRISTDIQKLCVDISNRAMMIWYQIEKGNQPDTTTIQKESWMNIREKIQNSLWDTGAVYVLKSNEEIKKALSDFGCGVLEVHTADIERLVQENDHLLRSIEDIACKNITLQSNIRSILNYHWYRNKDGYPGEIDHCSKCTYQLLCPDAGFKHNKSPSSKTVKDL